MEDLKRLLEQHIAGFKPFIDMLPYPVSIHHADYSIAAANRAFIELLGARSFENLKCYELVHHTSCQPEGCPAVKTFESLKPESSLLFDPHLKRHLSIYTYPIFIESTLAGLTHSIIDVTDIKKKEGDFMELSETLSESMTAMKGREHALMESREAFLNMLEDVTESYKDLRELFEGFVRAMVNALDAKSKWTRGHSERVAHYAVQIATEMGLDEDRISDISLAGLLHDIGKIGTYDTVLDKPAKLTDEEFALVKMHPVQGTVILSGIKQFSNILPLIRHHHERIDGRGYPDGIKGEDIPLGAKILCAADTFDAIMADRPYRPSPGLQYGLSELKRCSGSQFDPQVVEAFLKVLSKM